LLARLATISTMRLAAGTQSSPVFTTDRIRSIS
jgi:hypothetical protein